MFHIWLAFCSNHKWQHYAAPLYIFHVSLRFWIIICVSLILSWSIFFVCFHNIAGWMWFAHFCSYSACLRILKHLAECNEIKIKLFLHCRCFSVLYYIRLHKDPKSCLPLFQYSMIDNFPTIIYFWIVALSRQFC